MRLGFACPYLTAEPEVCISQHAAIMHVAWQHPWVGTYCTRRIPHIKACETILDRALKNKNLDALFWTEDDCVLPVDAVTRLVSLLVKHPGADVATGITFMRHPPHHPMIADYGGILTQEILEGDRPAIDLEDPSKTPKVGQPHYRFVTRIDTGAEPFRVDAASMNALLFRRRALEKLASIPHPFNTGEDSMTTPDFAMFDRLRKAGNVLMVDPGLLTLHLGDRVQIGFDQWVEEMERMVARNRATQVSETVRAEP
jgi:hypothetical protein